jgi:hypothetical protein
MSATDDLRPWWERQPDRLRWELANFADAGLDARVEWNGAGEPLILTSIELSDGRTLGLRVTFPFEYPLMYPHVHVETGLIGPPHEDQGLLCLFDNPANQWHPQRGVAELVNENARGLLEDVLIGGPEVIAASEEQLPDVVSRRYITDDSRVVMVPDPFWNDPPDGVRSGAALLVGESSRRLLQWVERLGECDEALKDVVLCKDDVALARWAVLEEPPSGLQSPNGLLTAAREQVPDLLDPVTAGDTSMPPQWIALTYREEGPTRGQWRRAWSFIELTGPDTVPPSAEHMPQTQALRAAERQLRLPDLRGIDQAKIVLVGLGSLGSKVAVEMAKAGVGEIVLIDPDRYDVNNAVRHELPVWLAGALKTHGVVLASQQHNPFCKVEWESRRIGVGQDGAVRFLRHLDGAHLVVETTGSRSVTRVAERYCRVASVPLLTASLTRGSRGGDMVLLRSEACFDCFRLAQESGEIPKPEEGEQTLVVPVGCTDPAFSGTGFDSSTLASDVARMSIRATGLTDYPALDHDWAVMNFVSEPRWQQGSLEPDPACGHRP